MCLLRRLVIVLLAMALLATACTRGGPPAPVVRNGTAAGSPTVQSGTYAVRAGDTVYSIARARGVSQRAVIDANRLAAPYVLKVGQHLRVPPPRVHIVDRGDTLYGVSRRYGVDMASLARRNGLEWPYTIQVAQRLVLPGIAPPRQPQPRPAGATPTARGLANVAPQRKPPPSGATAAAPTAPQPAVAATSALPAPPPAHTDNGFLWPVQGRVIARYGTQGSRHNDGINIAAPAGTPVRASENGVVAYAGDGIEGFGNLLLIKHDRGYITAYAHNARLLVARGQIVRQGQAVATVGTTGGVSSPQLHFEIRRRTKAVDPARLLRGT